MNAIEHLVILMMENRSFDHYLGALSLAPENRADIDGLPNPLPAIKDTKGNDVRSWPMDATRCGYPDPPHGWNPAHADHNGGKNDGFVLQYQQAYAAQIPPVNPGTPMGYYTRKTLPVLYALADEFTVCDHWFGSVLSSTWPNRKYLHSGRRDADNDTQSLPPFPGFQTTPLYDALEDQPNPDQPGHNLSWKCYYSDLPFLAFWYRFAANHALHNFAHVLDFVHDCQADQLPTVSIVDPPFSLADDHPSHDPLLGEKFIGLIVDALTNSESWPKTALVILYDENGGFYDHVPPPPAPEAGPSDDSPLGFRVPAIVVSPYSKKRFACKTVFDHTAILQSIHTRWNAEFDQRFGPRWALMPDIWADCFDFKSPPRPLGTYTGQPLQDLNWGSGVHTTLTAPSNVLEGFLERIFVLPELKALDRRATVFDTLTAMEHAVISLKRMVP